MDKMVRTDWKRHSAPYDMTFDLTAYKMSVDEMFDEAMEAFTSGGGTMSRTPQPTVAAPQRTSTMVRERKKSIGVAEVGVTELSTDRYTPGVLKVFGETILPGVQYKSVLASCRSTAQELVKQALERFGLSASNYKHYVLCDVVGRYDSNVTDINHNEDRLGKWERVFARMLSDRDKPLLLQKFWKPIEGFSRRYELHIRESVTDFTDDDDTLGLNENARKILISKLRPGAIPLFDDATLGRSSSSGLKLDFSKMSSESTLECTDSESEKVKVNSSRSCPNEMDTCLPSKHPFFVNIRGFDVKKDKTVYVIKSKRFDFGNPNLKLPKVKDNVPRYSLYAPDIGSVHCCFKVYKFKRSNVVTDPLNERTNYFLELTPMAANISVNGRNVRNKVVVRSGDIVNIGIYYVFLFKDCSKGFDVPLSLPWLPVPDVNNVNVKTNGDVIDVGIPVEDESASATGTDDSGDMSVPERMSLSYVKDKEEDLVKYICAIIQQQNTSRTYPLTPAFLFGMVIEHASRKFEIRQLKHLFLRILYSVRENVAETAKSLSSGKFSCTLLDMSKPPNDRDQKLERLLLWISNCVQLLLFLKHTFQLPEVPLPERASEGARADRKSRKDENAKHALGQLVTGLEEIIMFCFQQSVYTITKALHPVLPALLNSNPFSDGNSETCSMEDVVRMLEALAEVTHVTMLHESITRQLFTYLFFFTNTNVFNKLIVEESGTEFYNWQSGVRLRANLGQLEDWATQNGLEDEFGQMFELLLAVTELLATSRNTLVKYQWAMMKTHYAPLTSRQLYHVISHYQLGRPAPLAWQPNADEMEAVIEETLDPIPLSAHPPFALPDNCGAVDLVRSPEDASFWNTLRRLKSLYGAVEDDSDSGFSISNTPRGSNIATNGEPFYNQEVIPTNQNSANNTRDDKSQESEPTYAVVQKSKVKLPVKRNGMNLWSYKVPKPGSGVCQCTENSDNDDVTRNSLTSDLMSEERRENVESSDSSREHDKNEFIATALSRSLKLNIKPICKTENKEKNVTPRYVKNKHASGNVADCSARTLPKSLQMRNRSNSIGAHSKKPHDASKQTLSFSVEDLPVKMLRHKPSASFEEAIERGYTSDTVHVKSASISEDEFSHTKPSVISSSLSLNKSVKPVIVPRSHLVRRHKSLVTSTSNSVSSDEVFVDEVDIDNLYQSHSGSIPFQTLPNKLSSFKPISTSKDSMVNPKKLKTNTQKIMAVSFDANSRRSSIELTKDELFLHDADINLEYADDNVNVRETDDNSSDIEEMLDSEVNEEYSGELFTEVNEQTLADLKRHGSSLNVAPSCETSPRMFNQPYVKVSEVVGVDEDRNQMSPCPLYTVRLEKHHGGLGLSLVDGLHTSLRLAGIYIRRIQEDSPAAQTGCLLVGDRILAVDGRSVIGADYQSTMTAIKEADDTLTLLIARGNESMADKVSVSQV
ncbi:ras-interacting protein 1-like [Mya arenaria]|uniref:ras-interacting protein 1-like n=1 Tax=Mya arenaria TaxID=6604 RepID=UPI0022E3752F|nr:ras-interacting protein 1-like [Mya arenaria]XP_052820988.1 ras-interacting protein 1-like [Mya arenaria]XP_052820998.1 ras-interacting protein 1-like [Mya arenaria]